MPQQPPPQQPQQQPWQTPQLQPWQALPPQQLWPPQQQQYQQQQQCGTFGSAAPGQAAYRVPGLRKVQHKG